MAQLALYGFVLRAGTKPDTVEVVDARNKRVAFVLEYVSVEDIETEHDFSQTVITLRVKGRLGVIEPEAKP